LDEFRQDNFALVIFKLNAEKYFDLMQTGDENKISGDFSIFICMAIGNASFHGMWFCAKV